MRPAVYTRRALERDGPTAIRAGASARWRIPTTLVLGLRTSPAFRTACVFSNSVYSRELPKATTPGGWNKQPMMLLGITRPGWGCESLLGHHEQLSEFASRDSLLVGRNFPVSESRETRRIGPREGVGLKNLAHPEAGFGRIPCIFPVDQGFRSRDGFAIDCALRHSLDRRQRLRGAASLAALECAARLIGARSSVG